MPPTRILRGGRWNGHLYIGSLSAAVSESWLQWAGVTHVVCVLGKYGGPNELTAEWVAAWLRTRNVSLASSIWTGLLMHQLSATIGEKPFI